MKSNKIYLLLLIILISASIALNIWQFLGSKNQFSAWQAYTSPKGFSFQYPKGHFVSESIDSEDKDNTIVFIAKKDTQGPPVLQMNVSPNYITFSLWEGIPWDGFPKIIETFRTNK